MALPFLTRTWWRYSLVAVVFLVIALVEATQMRVMDMAVGAKIPYLTLLRFPLAYYGFWALATPAIVALTRRVPLNLKRWPVSVGAHAAAWCALSLAHAAFRAPIHHFVYPWMKDSPMVGSLVVYYFVGNITNNLLIYSVIALVAYTVAYIRVLQEREIRASQLQAMLGEARLNALKMQIQPHFLFNTFNSISALMHKDVEAAENMMTDLSDLLRRTLETSTAHEVALREELELLEPYLAIQRTRFQDRLSVDIDVSPDVLSAMIPNLTLHTLVENALRHGVAQRSAGGRVWIRVVRENKTLVVTVSDNGPGIDASIPDPFDRGIGLRNTRDRLAQLYGGDYRFDISNRSGGGVSATVAIPFHERALHATEVAEASLV